MGINIGYLTANRTSAGDEVYTPFYAVEPLMEFLPKDKKIWCPFDEEWSAFYQYLTEQGFEVERSSLKEGKDFFHFEPDKWDILVSNPPFSKKNEVLKRAFSFQKPFALLLPVNSIQGKARYKIFNNEIQLLSFDSRVDYHTRQNMLCTTKGNHFGSAYFCRNLLPTKLELRELFSSITSGGGFTLGTYAAQDYDLSEAEKYYTELAYNLNRKIRMVSSDIDWQDGLAAFGADRNNIEDKPDEWRWGKSDVYDWEPQYDFNCYKLWAFLCAYNYDFDADNDDIYYWEFDGDMEDLLDDIFKEEYEFVYTYDNQSRWEYRNSFESKGYYSIESSGVSGDHGYIVISYPDALPFSGYCNDDTIYFDLSNGEVLNYNKSYAATGWNLKDQFKNDTDPDCNTYKGYYQNGETCGYGIYEDGKLTIPIPYVIPEKSWCSFLKKYDWKTDCRLYYNVKQKKTFDEVIADKLGGMSHKTERLQYYDLLVGNEDGTGTLYGNHQTIHNLLPNDTIRDYTLKREFGYEMTGWNTDSDGLYQGIKVYADSGTILKMPFSGKITDVDTDENKITIRNQL